MIDLGIREYNYTKYKVMIEKKQKPRRILLPCSCCCLFWEPSSEGSNAHDAEHSCTPSSGQLKTNRKRKAACVHHVWSRRAVLNWVKHN